MNELAVEVVDLTKIYNVGKPDEVRALNGATFSVATGTVTGLLGPNGAGKTTSLEILEGIRRATSGTVTVLGRRVDGPDRALYDRLGIQFQNSAYFDRLRVRELAELFASFYSDTEDPQQLLEAVNLVPRANAFVRQLSGGEAQRFSIAMAIVNKPEMLVLDEPTAGLDPVARRDVWAVVRRVVETGATVFLSTHDMAEAESMCDHVIMLGAGEVVATGTPVELVETHGLPLTVRFQCPRGAWMPGNRRYARTARRSEHGEADLWEVQIRQDEASLTELMADVAAISSAVSGLEMSRSSLEDVFVALAK